MKIDYKPLRDHLAQVENARQIMEHLNLACGDELEKRGYIFNFQFMRESPQCQINCHYTEKTMRDFEEDVQLIIDALPDKPQPSEIKPQTMGCKTVFCFQANWYNQIEMRAYETTGCKITLKEVTKIEAEVNCSFEETP